MGTFRRIHKPLAAALILAAALTAAPQALPAYAAGITRVVDDDGADCLNVTDSTIATAVAAVGTGPGTITVCPGTYPGAVTISGAHDITLLGLRGATLVRNRVSSTKSLVSVIDSTNITVQNLDIDGEKSLLNSPTVHAINFVRSSGSIVANTITGWRQPSLGPGQILPAVASISIYGYSGEKVSVTNNTISDFQTNGIVSVGTIDLSISGNQIDGTSNSSARVFGISVQANELGGKVENNTLTSDNYPSFTGDSTGIHIFESSNFQVKNNTLDHWGTGIWLGSFCLVLPTANDNVIAYNHLTNMGIGIWMTSAAHTSCDAHTDDNQIVFNDLTNTQTPANIGIGVDSADPDPYHPPAAYTLNAVVQYNTVTHFGNGVMKVGSKGHITGVFSPNTVNP